MGVGKVAHKHVVAVCGQDYEVETYQEFETTWSAAGTYEGGYIATADRSESMALRRWEEAARSRGRPRTINEPAIRHTTDNSTAPAPTP